MAGKRKTPLSEIIQKRYVIPNRKAKEESWESGIFRKLSDINWSKIIVLMLVRRLKDKKPEGNKSSSFSSGSRPYGRRTNMTSNQRRLASRQLDRYNQYIYNKPACETY